MVGDRFSSSTSCSGWLHETAPARPDPSLSCLFLKVATHPFLRTEELLFEYACHEGNYSMTNILGGERALEKAASK